MGFYSYVLSMEQGASHLYVDGLSPKQLVQISVTYQFTTDVKSNKVF
jgi:hypothetical protein